MKVVVNFTTDFNKIKKTFSSCDEVSFHLTKDSLAFIAKKAGIIRVKFFNVYVQHDLGVDDYVFSLTMLGDTLLRLPSKSKKDQEVDKIKFEITENTVLLGVNEYDVEVPNIPFDATHMNALMRLQDSTESKQIDFRGARTLTKFVSKEDSAKINFLGEHVYMVSEKNVYRKKVDFNFELAFAISAKVLNQIKHEENIKAFYHPDWIVVQAPESGTYYFCQQLKPDKSLGRFFEEAKTFRTNIKVHLDLNDHNEFLKRMSKEEMELNFKLKRLTAKTSENERVIISLRDKMAIDILTQDFEKTIQLQEFVEQLVITDRSLLTSLSTLEERVTLNVTPTVTQANLGSGVVVLIANTFMQNRS